MDAYVWGLRDKDQNSLPVDLEVCLEHTEDSVIANILR